MRQSNKLTLKTLTKSSVWDIQENDVFRLWESAEKDADLKDNITHYLDVLRSAFTIEEVKIDRQEVISKYEARGFKVGLVRIDDNSRAKWAIKKKPISRITDLTYENISHISATKLIEVLERNFGGGWESLPQSIQDIILSGFDISTTTLPTSRLKRPGGLYQKKVDDGYEVLEIAKGNWTEAIFAKAKPQIDKFKLKADEEAAAMSFDAEKDPDSDEEPDTHGHGLDDDDDDPYDDDKLTEESYRTTYETSPEDLEKLAAEGVADEEAY